MQGYVGGGPLVRFSAFLPPVARFAGHYCLYYTKNCLFFNKNLINNEKRMGRRGHRDFLASLVFLASSARKASFWRTGLLSPTVSFLQLQLVIKLAKEYKLSNRGYHNHRHKLDRFKHELTGINTDWHEFTRIHVNWHGCTWIDTNWHELTRIFGATEGREDVEK